MQVSTAFSQPRTAIASLSAIVGVDKVARHDLIVEHVGTILALALAATPAKGYGNPADHAKVAQVFTAAKMTRYAEACVGLKAALQAKGFRSIPEWDDALLEGFAMADSMLADLRPKTYTKAQLKEREEAAAKRKVAKEQERKDEAAKAEQAQKDAIAAAYAKGQAEAQPPVITAEMIADMVRAGQFNADGLRLIAEAIMAASATEVQPRLIAA